MGKDIPKTAGNEPRIHSEDEGDAMSLERLLKGLNREERKLYETCLSLLQSIGENGNLEEVCEWLEQKAEKARSVLTPEATKKENQ